VRQVLRTNNDEIRMTKPRKYTSIAGILRRFYAAKLEGMTNNQMAKDTSHRFSSFGFRHSFVIGSS
jgi:hypothetical protein